VQSGIQVLKALDGLQPISANADETLDAEIDRRIEEAVAAQRAKANL
jgi:hypothetical protein